MKSPDYIVNLSGKLYDYRSASSLYLNNFVPLSNNAIFCQQLNKLHETIGNKIVTYKYVQLQKNYLYFDINKKSYMYFQNPKIQPPYSIVVQFKALSGAKQFMSHNSGYPTNNPNSYVPFIYFDSNGSIVFQIYNIASSTYNTTNVFDGNIHSIVLQVGSNYYKYTVDKDVQNSIKVSGNINLSWSTYFVIGAGYGRNWGNSWNYFNGYIYKFAIYNTTFSQTQLEKVLKWL